MEKEDNWERVKKELDELKYGLLKAQTNYEVLREWIYTNQIGHPVKNFFLRNNFRRIAIYGMGEIGLLLSNELIQCSEIEIVYAIDQNVNKIPLDIPLSKICLPERKVDVIVVTPEFAFADIKQNINRMGKYRVISIMEVIINA